MKWTRKALLQRVLSGTPKGDAIYGWGQEHFGRLKDYKVEGKVRAAKRMLRGLHDAGSGIEGKRTLEIGTGPIPVLPLLFWLSGHEECTTFDISKLLKPELVIEAARQLALLPSAAHGQWQSNKIASDYEAKRRMLGKLLEDRANASYLLKCCHIEYKAPVDFSQSNLSPESIDIVYSNTVLEHIPEQELHRVFAEAFRLLRPGGCMLHIIDLSDHFSHTDKAISSINFLQFSEQSYSKYQSRFLYQNRLREPFWRPLFINHGFNIAHWQRNVNERAMKDLGLLNIHRDFSHLTSEELCTSSICVVAQKLNCTLD